MGRRLSSEPVSEPLTVYLQLPPDMGPETARAYELVFGVKTAIATEEGPVLRLTTSDEPPAVRGVLLPESLPLAVFNILKAMLEAGCLDGERLTEAELEVRSGHPNPVRSLRRLRSHPEHGAIWRTVLVFPGRNGRGGYGFAPN